jgi:hypothetical protein
MATAQYCRMFLSTELLACLFDGDVFECSLQGNGLRNVLSDADNNRRASESCATR